MKAINCMVDWLEFSVFDIDIDTAMSVLDINDLFYENRKSSWYDKILVFDNCITVATGMKGNAEDNHVHIKITGKGCRLLEQKLNTKNIRDEIRNRFLFLVDKLKVSRMDICVDYDSKFVAKDFMSEVMAYKYSGIRKHNHAGSDDDGHTLYFGSKKSEKFFRMYEKDYESKNFELYKDRLELVLKNEYATYEFFNENDLYKIISSYMEDIKFYKKELQEEWDNMKGEKCEISPKIRHKKTTLEEKTEYILNTFGKTLKAYAEQYGTTKITSAIHEAVLSQKDIRMINNAKVINIIRAKRKLSENYMKSLYNSKIDNKPVEYEQLAL